MSTHLYFIEEKHYSLDEIKEVFATGYIDYLKRLRICMEIKNSTMIKFSFVGVLIYYKKHVLILPKYIKLKNERANKVKMKLLLRVIRKYNRMRITNLDSIDLSNNQTNDPYTSIFATAGFILDDYLNYGFYARTKKDLALNGIGEIDWSHTIDEIDPIISLGIPYYFDFFTHNEFVDEDNIVLRIHKWAVSHCSSLFGEWLDYAHIDFELKDPTLKSIGTKEYLLANLKNELNQTYIDQKVNLIKVLIAIVEDEFDLSAKQLDIYGVRNFEVIWEEVCRTIFEDEFDHFRELIPSPQWTYFETNLTVEKDSFIPDIIRTHSFDNKEFFLILDAKYYHIKISRNNIIGNPSVNDVAKQLLYQKALLDEAHGKNIRNYFLFPHDGDQTEKIFEVIGKVTLDFIIPDPIVLVYLLDEKVYNMYLNNDVLKEKEYRELELQTKQKV